ncbi:ribosomal protein S6 [Mucidula mucida]|nr:ribosomal protein S6 [Mucidula mucida]
MPLYQMVCIAAHTASYQSIKHLVTQSALQILNNGGVVRKIDSWGTHTLPYRMGQHHLGDYWSLHFDTSPRVLTDLNRFLRRDPLVLRWTILKQGEKLEDVSRKGRRLIHSPLKQTDQMIL